MDVLVEARREYLQTLYETLVPEMISSLYNLYLESEKMLKNQNNRLIQYQKFLQEIKHWNNSIVKEHTDAIKRECPWFDDLVVAVIVSSVKIMSSVRINNNNTGKLSLNVPKTEDFVHECYKKAAEDVYNKPFVMADLMTDDEREDALWDRIAECIEKVIKTYIPLQQILAMNVSSPPSGGLVIEDGPVDDSEDPDVQEAMPEEEMHMEEPMGEAPPEPPGPVPAEEVKSIPVSAENMQPPQEESDVLFPDAPEKNLARQ